MRPRRFQGTEREREFVLSLAHHLQAYNFLIAKNRNLKSFAQIHNNNDTQAFSESDTAAFSHFVDSECRFVRTGYTEDGVMRTHTQVAEGRIH
jgi:hypothetical protein